MAQVKYIGGASQRILSSDDMIALGVEEHPGLWFGPAPEIDPFAEIVVEVDDETAAVLCSKLKNEFQLVVPDVDEIVEEKTRDELYDEAKELGLTGLSKAGKEEIAEAIAAKLEADGLPTGDASEELEPTA